jgi:glycosidase
VASQIADPRSLWHLYRRLIALRHAEAALATGGLDLPSSTPSGRGLAVILRKGAGRILVVANLEDRPAPEFAVDVPGAPKVLLEEGLLHVPKAAERRVLFPSGLTPHGFAFVRLD